MTFGNVDRPFWCNRVDWPRDIPGHVFLLRAFDRLGKAFFGASWDAGRDILVSEPRRPDPKAMALATMSAEARAELNALIESEATVYERLLPNWRCAQHRLSRVRDTLADWAATGQLETVWKGDGPGAPVPIKPEMWQFGDTALLMARFYRGRISRREAVGNPDRTGLDSDNGWICVVQASLDQLLSPPSEAAPSTEPIATAPSARANGAPDKATPPAPVALEDAAEGVTYLSGTAGRPTSMPQFILPEASRRLAGGERPPSKLAFAESLSEWLSTQHPRAHSVQPKSITNNPEFTRLWREAQNQWREAQNRA
jgi:hypothetical protein